MRSSILLQILAAGISICICEHVSSKKVFLQNEHKQVAIEQVNGSHVRNGNEFYSGSTEGESEENDLDFDYNYDDDSSVKESDAEQEMQEILLKAMRKPTIRKQIGEVVPILRAMSPAQRLTLAALVSSQIMSQKPLSENRLTEVAAMFAGKKLENADDRHNITEQLLLPISMDIAQMFRGLGREVGRNLRHNFYAVQNNESKKRRKLIRNPINSNPSATANRRVDDIDYYEDVEEDGESFEKPVAEALRRPGKEECDYFTKSLCLEVSNYPTEAIILSLRKNADIANTFLTDFYKNEIERKRKPESSGRHLERREDSKNEIQEHSEDGYMCPSSVKYARPKRARTTSGHWKYVVNAGDYTQTLRLEICSKPKSPCSFVTNHLRSECSQVYNYHRLLTWDENKGLHMDIFKVPSCCSCHIQGYSNFYPPSDFTLAEKRHEATDFSQNLRQQQNPQINFTGNKRDVPHPTNLENEQSIIIKPQIHQSFNSEIHQPPNQLSHPNIHNFIRDPVDHLIPPGPLPLENEKHNNNAKVVELKFHPDKILLEQNRRFPGTIDNVRPIKEASDRIIIHDPETKTSLHTSKPQIKIPPPVPSVPQGLFTSQIHLPPRSPHIPLENNQNFESGSQTRHLGPSVSIPSLQLPKLENQNAKPSESGLFFTHLHNSEHINQNGIKSKPNQYFIPENKDSKGISSKVRPIFAEKPKLDQKIILATTPLPKKLETISPSGQRKINYNYHPIIDFFTFDSKRSHQKFSSPQYLPLTSQGWTPMVRPQT